MYLPKHFEETRVEVLHRLVAEHPLGALVTHGPGGLDANHVPFELDPQSGPHGCLRAHVARANPVWRELADGTEVLVIFRGADAYVSPNWYPSKKESEKVVPTWNYQVVHVHGQVTIRDDERFVRGLVARLTRAHEASHSPGAPWKMTDAPPEFIDQMLASVVGLEVAITRIVGKFKLSQNREARDRRAVVRALEARGDARGAAAIRAADPEPAS